MKIPQHHYRCPLGTKQPIPFDADQVKREGWRGQNILVVAADDERLDWVEREFVKRIGERLYGTKGGKHHG